MITTNCGQCGIEIDMEMSQKVKDYHLCQDCYFDYFIMTRGIKCKDG